MCKRLDELVHPVLAVSALTIQVPSVGRLVFSQRAIRIRCNFLCRFNCNGLVTRLVLFVRVIRLVGGNVVTCRANVR